MSFHGRHGFLLLPGRGRTREMAISISFSCVLELLYNETGRSISTIMSIKRVMSSLEEVDLFWCFERIVCVNIWVRKRYMTVLFWASRVWVRAESAWDLTGYMRLRWVVEGRVVLCSLTELLCWIYQKEIRLGRHHWDFLGEFSIVISICLSTITDYFLLFVKSCISKRIIVSFDWPSLSLYLICDWSLRLVASFCVSFILSHQRSYLVAL